MFSKKSMLKDINILSKFIALIFVILGIILVKNKYIILLISFIFLYFEKHNILSILALILSIISIFYDLNVLIRLLQIIMYLDLFIKIADFNEYRYLIEKLFYRSGNKLLNCFLYLYYFFKYYKKHIKSLLDEIKSYGFKIDIKLLFYAVKEGFSKTKIDVDKIKLTYKYRFYQLYRSKSYYERDIMDSYDYKYILIHVILFLIVYTYWR